MGGVKGETKRRRNATRTGTHARGRRRQLSSPSLVHQENEAWSREAWMRSGRRYPGQGLQGTGMCRSIRRPGSVKGGVTGPLVRQLAKNASQNCLAGLAWRCPKGPCGVGHWHPEGWEACHCANLPIAALAALIEVAEGPGLPQKA